MAVWLLSLLFSGCLALPKTPTLVHPGQDLIDGQASEDDWAGESRIIGGSEASISDYPWQASLRNSGSHICGAVILSKDFVLTAAHCVDGGSASSYSIRVGSANRNSGGSTHSVSTIVGHPDFRNTATTTHGGFPNDVAVLKLSSSIVLDSNKKAIPLTTKSNNALSSFPEADCVITGWGRTSSSGSLPTVLRKTNVKVVTDTVCRQDFGDYLVNDIHICVDGAGSSGSCNGDSGGPLACNEDGTWKLAGVTSFGFSGCPTTTPSVYAETLEFTNWIGQQMASL